MKKDIYRYWSQADIYFEKLCLRRKRHGSIAGASFLSRSYNRLITATDFTFGFSNTKFNYLVLALHRQ
jgi:hypothetical protein